MSSQYIFDKDNFKFRKAKTSVWAVIRKILMFFVGTLSMAVLYYVIFALVFSTEEERRLRQENRLFEKEIPELERKERLLYDVVEGLKIKDDRIYEEIFHTSSPGMDRFAAGSDLTALDSIPVGDIDILSARRLAELKQGADSVEANFRSIMKAITDSGFVIFIQLLVQDFDLGSPCCILLFQEGHLRAFQTEDRRIYPRIQAGHAQTHDEEGRRLEDT